MPDKTSEAILQDLVTRQILPAEKAQEITTQLEQQGGDLRAILVESGLVDDEHFTYSQAVASGMPYVNLSDITIPKEVLNIIPESTARGHSIIAYQQTEEALRVATSNPRDRQIIEFVRKKVDMPVEVALASAEGVRLALAQYQGTLQGDLQTLVQEAEGALTGAGDLSKVAEDLPIIKMTETILKHAILQGASDIHIEPTETQVIIRYRIDGLLSDVLTLSKQVMAGIVARIKVLSNLKIDEHRLPQDGRFKLESDDYRVAFRVSILPVFDGEKVVMRLLDESGRGLTLDDIGMSARTLEIFRQNIGKPHGMVLVTGPTGSGKTTTLYAAMREMNTPDVNISTIEDPIEYRMERINQTQVQPKIGLTFANGLRALVRQDPDIIMVGEIRDEETASLAVNAALTGHLVLSTLHTNSAAGAVPRLIDMSVEPFLIASTTNMLLAQRLVRKICQECSQQAVIEKGVVDSLGLVVDLEILLATLQREGAVEEGTTWKNFKVHVPQGCNKCNDGYRGRVGIYEIMAVTPEIQKLITSHITTTDLEKAAREQQKMVTMIEDGIMKVVQGMTSVEEVLRVAKE